MNRAERRRSARRVTAVTDAGEAAVMRELHTPLHAAAVRALAGEQPLAMLCAVDAAHPERYAFAALTLDDAPKAGAYADTLRANARGGVVVICGTREGIADLCAYAPPVAHDVRTVNPRGAVLVTIRGDEAIIWPCDAGALS